jgi:coxsackievirus/adenovirus receptor
LAEEQGETASEIESIAKQANEISADADKKAWNAMNEQVKTSGEIGDLQAQLKFMGNKLSEVQTDAQETLQAADDAYMQALRIYQQVFNLQVPEVDTSRLDDQASKVTKDAERIRDDAQRLIKEHEELLTTAMNKRQELNDLLNNALTQQQQVDSKMADMDEHRSRALKAVELGNTVLEEAKRTLATLQDFENRVNENREAANSALDKILDIERTVRDSRDKTASAYEALENTDNNAILAYEVAVESKTTAEEASQNAASIVAESAKVKEAAEQLNTDAQSLEAKSADTAQLVEYKTKKTSEEDAQLASEALREANKAQSSSLEATQKVEQAKRELEEIAQILSSIEEQDSSSMDDLERRLDVAEQKYIEADLEARLKELEEAKQRQLLRKTELKNEYELVKEEVDTIRDIIGQLPDFCPNAIEHGLEV